MGKVTVGTSTSPPSPRGSWPAPSSRSRGPCGGGAANARGPRARRRPAMLRSARDVLRGVALAVGGGQRRGVPLPVVRQRDGVGARGRGARPRPGPGRSGRPGSRKRRSCPAPGPCPGRPSPPCGRRAAPTRPTRDSCRRPRDRLRAAGAAACGRGRPSARRWGALGGSTNPGLTRAPPAARATASTPMTLGPRRAAAAVAAGGPRRHQRPPAPPGPVLRARSARRTPRTRASHRARDNRGLDRRPRRLRGPCAQTSSSPSMSGRGGKAPVGGAWYQHATDAKSSCRSR